MADGFTSKRELVQMIASYIRYYNTGRVRHCLGMLTPIEKSICCVSLYKGGWQRNGYQIEKLGMA